MKNWRLSAFFLVGVSLVIISCSGQENRNVSKQDAEGTTTEIVQENNQNTESQPVRNTKVAIRRNRLTAVRTNPPIQDMVEFLSLYTDEELAVVELLDLSWNQIEVVAGLKRMKSLRSLELTGNRIKEIDTRAFPESIVGLGLDNNPIFGSLYIGSDMRNIVDFGIENAEITHIYGLENFPIMLRFSLFNNPIENPEEFLKIYGVVGELKFTYAPNISFDQAVEIEAQLREQNPEADLILILPFIPIEKREIPDT